MKYVDSIETMVMIEDLQIEYYEQHSICEVCHDEFWTGEIYFKNDDIVICKTCYFEFEDYHIPSL